MLVHRLAAVAALAVLVLGIAPPPAAQAATTTVTIDGTAPGRTFDGVGAISGGGGNSRLLIDYPEPQRSQILDYLFKPGYGASVQLLKVEIGGDTNSTSGAEPSHQHSAGDLNCGRGYEWWLLEQAKARNPNLKVIGLSWGAPGWIGNGNFWSADMTNYLVRWLDCARTAHGVTVDYLGGWNERGFDAGWYVNTRAALNAAGYGGVKLIADDSSWDPATAARSNPAFAAAVAVYGSHYICGYRSDQKTCSTTADNLASGKPLWAAENGSDDFNSGAVALARGINRGYLDAKLTAYLNWPVIAALTPNLPYPTMGVATAQQPWSGNYAVGKNAWVMAQTTQFTAPGWRYLDTGSGYLGGDRNNGSYVSLRSPAGDAWTTVAETADATAAQSFTAHVTGGLPITTVHVWRTKLAGGGDDLAHVADLAPNGGTVTLTLDPGYVYTLTTGTGGGHGTATAPAGHALALPYSDNYDGYATGTEARYLSDMQGAFEVAGCGGGRAGRCVRQMAPRLPILWAAANDNLALVGDVGWTNYTVSTDVLLEQAGYAQLIGRGGGQHPGGLDGYYLQVSDTGQWSVRRNDVHNAMTVLASGGVAALGTGRWHTLALTFSGTTLTAKIDGATVATLDDQWWTAGQAGLGSSQGETAQFDNLQVTPVSGPPAPAAGHLVNPVSGRCLDIAGESQTPGALADLWECNGQANQQFVQGSDGTLRLYGRSMCLDVLGQATAAGSPVGIWGCNGGPNQQWTFHPDGTLTGVQSGLCLDVTGASTANDAPIEIWTCNGGGNQKWSW
jgi:hypothetical protein